MRFGDAGDGAPTGLSFRFYDDRLSRHVNGMKKLSCIHLYLLAPNKQSGRKLNKQEKEPLLKKGRSDPGCRLAGFRKHETCCTGCIQE